MGKERKEDHRRGGGETFLTKRSHKLSGFTEFKGAYHLGMRWVDTPPRASHLLDKNWTTELYTASKDL